jgi:hypothetical protein
MQKANGTTRLKEMTMTFMSGEHVGTNLKSEEGSFQL